MLIQSMLKLIGNTPIIKLNNIETFGNNIYLKLEGSNPSKSTKDRIALAMIEDAEKSGKISKKTTIIEATSGNTGISLAMICALKKYRLKIIMPDNMSVERIQLMRAYGAEVILTPGHLGMKGCSDKLELIKEETKDYFIPNQFSNPRNPGIHYETTANEILKDLNNKIDYFICGTGTGGSFSGIAKRLKEVIPSIQNIALEPDTSPLISKGYTGSHKIQGMGMSLGKIPDVFNNSLADKVLLANYDKSIDYMKKLAKEEGILAGISTGATLSSAIEICKNNKNKNLNIVVFSNDSGEKYLSSNIF